MASLVPQTTASPRPPAEEPPPAALSEARSTAAELTETIKGLLQQELARGGFETSLEVCAKTAQARTREFRARTGRDVRRVSLRYRNPTNAPDDYERRVLEGFDRMTLEERARAEHYEVVSEDGRQSLRYLKPLLTATLCLTCHGERSQIPPGVRVRLERSYPDDRATGFKVGDVRGAVSVRIPLDTAPTR